jgi:hypothetical protein
MNKKLLVISGIILAAALSRLLPHADNFSPIGAIALFAGAFIANRFLAFVIPVLALVLSDALMGFPGWAYPSQIIMVYLTFGLITLLGSTLKNNKGALRVGATSLASSLVFFVVTNFVVWLGGFYAMNFSGLVNCYVSAIPFFKSSLAGDLFYTTVLFGGFYLIQINAPKLVEEQA